MRLDSTGLYYYNARYYDANIGRFISADTIVQDSTNPQCLNRYSYVLNNPLKYIDPTGTVGWGLDNSTAEGQLGWTSEGGWTIGYAGERKKIREDTVNWVVKQRADMPNWSGNNYATLALKRESGIKFNTAVVYHPSDFANWESPVSDIKIDIYILYLTENRTDFEWTVLAGNPARLTDYPFIYVNKNTPLGQAQAGMPEEFFHVVQETNTSFWKLKYGFNHAIHGFDHDKNPWEIEAMRWSEQINKKGLNLYVGPATR